MQYIVQQRGDENRQINRPDAAIYMPYIAATKENY